MASTKRILELDGLRGLAIALVILFHIELLFPSRWHMVGSAMLFGWSGVDLFFVLSGFLIGGILLDHRDTENYFSVFYVRRFFRIVPVYLAVLGLFAGAWALGGVVRESMVGDLGLPMPWYTYLSFTNNLWIARHDTMHIFLPVSWSLAVEEQFYLTLPLMVRFLPRKALLPTIGALIPAIAAFRGYACWHGLVTQNQAYVLPCYRAEALLIGVVCAILVRDEQVIVHLQRVRWALIAAAAALAVAIVKLGTALPVAEASADVPLMTFGLTLIAFFYAMLLLMAVARPYRALSVVLRWSPLRTFGNLSYCVYLIHEGIMGAFQKEVWPLLRPHVPGQFSCVLMALAVAVTVAIAQGSWRVLESRMLRIGHRFTYRYGADAGQMAPAEANA